jgi:hypothetical protein
VKPRRSANGFAEECGEAGAVPIIFEGENRVAHREKRSRVFWHTPSLRRTWAQDALLASRMPY